MNATAHVVVTGRRRSAPDEAVAATGPGATGVRADSSDLADLDRLVATVAERGARPARRSGRRTTRRGADEEAGRMSTHDVSAAKSYAEQASANAEKLKAGTWESVQALALTSIAHSLAALADRPPHP